MKTPSGCCEPWSAGHAPRIYSTMIPNVTSSSSTNPPDLAFAEGFGGHEVFFVQVAHWFAGVVADLLEDFNDLQLVRPGLRQRAGLVGPHPRRSNPFAFRRTWAAGSARARGRRASAPPASSPPCAGSPIALACTDASRRCAAARRS